MAADGPGDFVEKVRSKIQNVLDYYRSEYGDDFKNYTFEFGIACPGTDEVKSILESNLAKEMSVDVKAIAFEPCEEPVQVEGIMLALRALHANSLESLKNAFASLARRGLSEEERAIVDINEFVMRIKFILPSAREINYNDVLKLNHIIRDNIKTAA